ncbi:MAG: methyltransferase [Candidatus Aenigmarchaeota archaeon]|nr:methyltransferase [Candidatus Aenigmarchaeota archaeon]
MQIYQPREDSYLLEKYVKKLARGKVLDMGTGSGIQARAALEKADNVLAVDINMDAVNNLEGFEKLTAIRSDLFENVKGKFDVIIFNAPYLPSEGEFDPALDGGAKGFEVIERFLTKAKDFLEKDGFMLLVFSSFTDKKKVDQLIKENGFSFELLEKIHISFEDIYCYRLTIAF